MEGSDDGGTKEKKFEEQDPFSQECPQGKSAAREAVSAMRLAPAVSQGLPILWLLWGEAGSDSGDGISYANSR